MKYQRAKYYAVQCGETWIQAGHDKLIDTPDHNIPQTVIEALTAMPNMPVMIGGYLYRVVS